MGRTINLMLSLGSAPFAEDAAARIVMNYIADNCCRGAMFAAYARRWNFAEFRVAVFKQFVAQNIGVGEVITANP